MILLRWIVTSNEIQQRAINRQMPLSLIKYYEGA